jgi:hypothetical protein
VSLVLELLQPQVEVGEVLKNLLWIATCTTTTHLRLWIIIEEQTQTVHCQEIIFMAIQEIHFKGVILWTLEV